ncbi:hypothetical protein DL765_007646 [Monosporascus sp. GIB2]|nr:hypothetical protein DL765_007646 [Monosporascus sp. GIB2]
MFTDVLLLCAEKTAQELSGMGLGLSGLLSLKESPFPVATGKPRERLPQRPVAKGGRSTAKQPMEGTAPLAIAYHVLRGVLEVEEQRDLYVVTHSPTDISAVRSYELRAAQVTPPRTAGLHSERALLIMCKMLNHMGTLSTSLQRHRDRQKHPHKAETRNQAICPVGMVVLGMIALGELFNYWSEQDSNYEQTAAQSSPKVRKRSMGGMAPTPKQPATDSLQTWRDYTSGEIGTLSSPLEIRTLKAEVSALAALLGEEIPQFVRDHGTARDKSQEDDSGLQGMTIIMHMKEKDDLVIDAVLTRVQNGPKDDNTRI